MKCFPEMKEEITGTAEIQRNIQKFLKVGIKVVWLPMEKSLEILKLVFK
jgi:hypothetical protein